MSYLVEGIAHEDKKKKTRRPIRIRVFTVHELREVVHDPLGRATGLHYGLRYLGLDGTWFNVRLNGRFTIWKRDLNRISIPLKYGFYEAFRVTEHEIKSGFFGQEES